MKLLRKEEMPENATAGDFVTEVVWIMGVVIVATVGLHVTKRGYRKIASFRKA
jgi:hypothetical protein